MTATAAGARAAGGEQNRQLWIGVARAFGGATIFALPMLMTMEMWWLGFYMDRLRLALFMVVMIPMLIGLDHYVGFRDTTSWLEDVADGLVAYGVGIAASTVVLLLLNVLHLDVPLREWVGKIALQAIPASFGAVLATSQLGQDENREAEDSAREQSGYGSEIFLMTAGAVFLAFNLAPTEEMILIAFRLTPWHGVVLILASLAMMHAFVYSVEFHGTHREPEGTPGWSVFLRFTVVGYVAAVAVSIYVLWTFGRFDDAAFGISVMQTVVLAVPAALGAAAARLII